MLETLSAFLIDKLLDGQDKEIPDKEVYIYGMQTLIYSFVSTIWLIFLGFLLHKADHACIVILVFYTCQTAGGGKHAHSRIACLTIMSMFLCSCLMICEVDISPAFCIVLSISAAVYLLYVPLILHPNKSYLNLQKHKLIRRSRIITTVFCLGLIPVYLFLRKYMCAYSMGLLCSALSRHAATLENMRQN